MKRIEKLLEEVLRGCEALQWAVSIEKLKHRKNNPLDEGEFCAKYKLQPQVFNRNKKGVTIPTVEQRAAVKAAFDAEGV